MGGSCARSATTEPVDVVQRCVRRSIWNCGGYSLVRCCQRRSSWVADDCHPYACQLGVSHTLLSPTEPQSPHLPAPALPPGPSACKAGTPCAGDMPCLLNVHLCCWPHCAPGWLVGWLAGQAAGPLEDSHSMCDDVGYAASSITCPWSLATSSIVCPLCALHAHHIGPAGFYDDLITHPSVVSARVWCSDLVAFENISWVRPACRVGDHSEPCES
jgi:hypothetical protein